MQVCKCASVNGRSKTENICSASKFRLMCAFPPTPRPCCYINHFFRTASRELWNRNSSSVRSEVIESPSMMRRIHSFLISISNLVYQESLPWNPEYSNLVHLIAKCTSPWQRRQKIKLFFQEMACCSYVGEGLLLR